jgi:hypothetical protein
MNMRGPIALLLSAVPLIVSATAPAEAESRRWSGERTLGYVTAESRYGAGSITAPVRISMRGRREVRLPGGTWIECRRSCANTLRQETIDFWHIRNTDPSGDDGPGYLTFRFRY